MNKLMKGIAVMMTAVLIFAFAGCSSVDNTEITFEGAGLKEAQVMTLKTIKNSVKNEKYIGIAYEKNDEYTEDGENGDIYYSKQIEGVTLEYLLKNMIDVSDDASIVIICAKDGFRLQYDIKNIISGSQTPCVLVWKADGRSVKESAGQPLNFYDTGTRTWVYGVESIKIR